MSQLNVDTGVVAYTVNGGSEISFNPADPEFAARVVKAFQRCTEIAQNVKAEKIADANELFALTKDMDNAVRAEIDAAFAEPVSEKVFGRGSTISIAGGMPVWANFLLAVVDEIDSHVTEEKKKTNLAVQKYMKKYEKKYGKRRNARK